MILHYRIHVLNLAQDKKAQWSTLGRNAKSLEAGMTI